MGKWSRRVPWAWGASVVLGLACSSEWSTEGPSGHGEGALGVAGAGGSLGECGNGKVEAGESCDDGFTDECGSCNADCSDFGSGSLCDDAAFCEETELFVCDCSQRPVHGVDDGVLRLVVLGDGGTGKAAQFQVAEAVAAVCADHGGCDLALYLGDNIYEDGVATADDPQFDSKFEMPYCGLDFPFFVALGNHDYGNTRTLVAERAAGQVAYSERSLKWRLPDYYYSVAFEEGETSLEVFTIDTPRLQFGVDNAEQARWLEEGVARSSATWKLVMGHHTYVSNGLHGNAGSYDATVSSNPIVTGGHLQAFFERALCHDVDLYLSGHDHNRQWLEAECGLEVVVSGAAAKRSPLAGRDDNVTHFEADEGFGFAMLELEGETLTGRFYDESGKQEFERILRKRAL